MVSDPKKFPFSSLPDEQQGYLFKILIDNNPQAEDGLHQILVSKAAAAW